MSKHTAMVLLGLLVVALPILGFPPGVRDFLLIVSGLAVASLAYLSSVVYCSNCKKLIEEADQVLSTPSDDVKSEPRAAAISDIRPTS